MITLQADPLIEWDDTKTNLTDQTTDSQEFVQENILNTEPVNTNETVARPSSGRSDLTRIKSQVYTGTDFNITITRTYRSVENCAVASSTYVLVAN